MISRFLYLSAVLSVVCYNVLFYASEAPAPCVLWISETYDGTEGMYIAEDFKTGKRIQRRGKITTVGTHRFHMLDRYIYVTVDTQFVWEL
jgi:hypothetical protein